MSNACEFALRLSVSSLFLRSGSLHWGRNEHTVEESVRSKSYDTDQSTGSGPARYGMRWYGYVNSNPGNTTSDSIAYLGSSAVRHRLLLSLSPMKSVTIGLLNQALCTRYFVLGYLATLSSVPRLPFHLICQDPTLRYNTVVGWTTPTQVGETLFRGPAKRPNYTVCHGQTQS